MAFYAVKRGRTPGIYTSWSECQQQTSGFSGAVFKSFETEEEAELFLEEQETKNEKFSGDLPPVYAFVDGSFNPKTSVYGYGGFLYDHGIIYELSGSGSCEELVGMRNIAGEILGAKAGIQKAYDLGLNDVTIIYDYMGIEEWANGTWQAKKEATKEYRDFVRDKRLLGMNIRFEKVDGHTGVKGNELADRLAKKAVGVFVKGDTTFLEN